MQHSAEETVEAIAKKMAGDLMETKATAKPAKTAPSQSPDLELPDFLDRQKSPAVKRKTRKTEIASTSREDYERKFPSARTPRDASKDVTSRKLLRLQESFSQADGVVEIDAVKFEAAIKLLRDDIGDMLTALGVEWGNDNSHRLLKSMLQTHVLEHCKFRTSSGPRKIVVR